MRRSGRTSPRKNHPIKDRDGVRWENEDCCRHHFERDEGWDCSNYLERKKELKLAEVRMKADLGRNYCKQEEDLSLDKEAGIKVKADPRENDSQGWKPIWEQRGVSNKK